MCPVKVIATVTLAMLWKRGKRSLLAYNLLREIIRQCLWCIHLTKVCETGDVNICFLVGRSKEPTCFPRILTLVWVQLFLCRLCEDFIGKHAKLFDKQLNWLPSRMRSKIDKRAAFLSHKDWRKAGTTPYIKHIFFLHLKKTKKRCKLF